MMRPPRHASLQRGFSLVELMIALTLGLLLTSAIGALFYANKRNFNQNTLIGQMQDNARFATQALTRDLEMAGFFGGLVDETKLVLSSNLPTLTTDCGPGPDGTAAWALDRGALEFQNDITGDDARAVYSCLPGGSGLVDGTDIVALRRVAGQPTSVTENPGDTPTLDANLLYLRTNGTAGSIFFSGAQAENPSVNDGLNGAAASFWEYYARLYFVRAFAQTPGDGIPTLCRAYVDDQATPTVVIEPIAEGVEDMQVAFGVDTDGDGTANRYFPDATQDQVDRAVTARIQLLMRSAEADRSYNNEKSYNLLGKDENGNGLFDEIGATPADSEGYRPQDNFYRRVAQTTIGLRNPTLARGFNP